MDQIEVYNRALTEEEIVSNYQNYKNKAVILNTTGLKEIPENSSLLLFPNPVTDKLNILIPDCFNNYCMVRISDVSGRLMHEKTIMNTRHYITNLNGYTNGVYIVEIADDTRKYSVQIIKK